MFTTVYAARTPIEAEFRISLLRSAGLHPPDLAAAGHVFFYGADSAFYVQVPPDEADEARELLRALAESLGAE